MILELGIKSGNAAFTDGGRYEVVRLLKQVAERIEAGRDGGNLLDINGNRCGSWYMEQPERYACDDCGQDSTEEHEDTTCRQCGRGIISEVET